MLGLHVEEMLLINLGKAPLARSSLSFPVLAAWAFVSGARTFWCFHLRVALGRLIWIVPILGRSLLQHKISRTWDYGVAVQNFSGATFEPCLLFPAFELLLWNALNFLIMIRVLVPYKADLLVRIHKVKLWGEVALRTVLDWTHIWRRSHVFMHAYFLKIIVVSGRWTFDPLIFVFNGFEENALEWPIWAQRR